VIFNPDFQVTILFNVKELKKRYKIELYLQCQSSRKSYYGLSNGAIFNNFEQPVT